MANQAHQNVGAAVSAVARVVDIDPVDWRIASWGDCREQLAKGVQREANKVARLFGFRDVAHLSEVAQERTSSRWVYFNFPRA